MDNDYLDNAQINKQQMSGLRMDEDLLPITFVHGIPGGIVKSVDIQDSSGGWKWVQVGGEADAGVPGK